MSLGELWSQFLGLVWSLPNILGLDLSKNLTGHMGGCLSILASPLFPADILKKVIREYKDVYSEIVNQAGRILQQVAGASCVAVGFGIGIAPLCTRWIKSLPPAGVWAAAGGDRHQTPYLHPDQQPATG